MILALLVLSGLVVLGVIIGMRWLDAVTWRRSLVAYQLQLPAMLSPDDVTRWLSAIAAATHAPRWSLLPLPPLGLEIVATANGIRHYLLVPKGSQEKLLSGLRAALPGARVEHAPDFLSVKPAIMVAG